MSTTKDLADRERDREYLESRGWRQKPCPNPHCNEHRFKWRCFKCDNKGFIWEAPLR